MVKFTLRGGNGEMVATINKPVVAKKPTPEELRLRLEVRLDLEAETEGRAIGQHRKLVPARERKYQRA